MLENNEDNFSFKSFFTPLTTLKAIHIIIFAGLIVFSNALFNGFVWDDKTYIINNSEVHKFDLSTLLGQNFFNSAGFYRPIPALYFAGLYSLSGATPFLYHLLQILLHIVNSVLVFILFKHFFNKNVSLLLALIFLVHPMNVESVSYIASSVSVLFFFFGLLALVLSFKQELKGGKLFSIFGLIFLSMLTKETGFLFLLLILLFSFFYKKRSFILFFLLSVATTILYLILRISTIGASYEKQDFIPIMKLSLDERFLNIPQIIFYYICTFIFPNKLAISQNWVVHEINFTDFYLPLFVTTMVFVVIGLLGYFIYKNKKEFFAIFVFFFFWFLIGLGMLLQIVPLDMTVADRWMYFPMVGLLGLVGVSIVLLTKRNPHLKKYILIAMIIIICLLASRTIVRNTNWSDAITLYTHDIQIQDDYNKRDGLGVEFIYAGMFDQAFPHIQKSVEMNPYYANVNDLGVVYQHLGDRENAKKYYTQAIDLNPTLLSPYINLATILVLYDSPKEAIPIIKNQLIKIHPDVPRFWVLLAIAEYKSHNQDAALQAVQRAYSLSTDAQTTYVYDIISNKKPIESIDNKLLE